MAWRLARRGGEQRAVCLASTVASALAVSPSWGGGGDEGMSGVRVQEGGCGCRVFSVAVCPLGWRKPGLLSGRALPAVLCRRCGQVGGGGARRCDLRERRGCGRAWVVCDM